MPLVRDGDGDRLEPSDRDALSSPHQIFCTARLTSRTRSLPGDIAKLVPSRSSSTARRKIGGNFIETSHRPSIHRELMLEQNILIGGEESGGIGTNPYIPKRDATFPRLSLRS